MASTAMKPTLCRLSAYCAPGLPRPTQSCMERKWPRRRAPGPGPSGFAFGGFLAGSRFLAFARLQSRRRDDRRAGEVAVGDAAFSALRQRHIGNENRRADIEPGPRNHEILLKVRPAYAQVGAVTDE